MCLTVNKNARRRIAKKDIIVYKHIMLEDGKYLTSYMKIPIIFNKLYKSELIFDKKLTFGSGTYLDIGLHSFKLKSDAIEQSIYWNEILVQCIIPKGSEYYIGGFDIIINTSTGDALYESYASNKIKYIKIIKDYGA